jgi:hypothetical protein
VRSNTTTTPEASIRGRLSRYTAAVAAAAAPLDVRRPGRTRGVVLQHLAGPPPQLAGQPGATDRRTTRRCVAPQGHSVREAQISRRRKQQGEPSLEIWREHRPRPWRCSPRTLVADGRLAAGVVSETTAARQYCDAGSSAASWSTATPACAGRRITPAPRGGDVCHGPTLRGPSVALHPRDARRRVAFHHRARGAPLRARGGPAQGAPDNAALPRRARWHLLDPRTLPAVHPQGSIRARCPQLRHRASARLSPDVSNECDNEIVVDQTYATCLQLPAYLATL